MTLRERRIERVEKALKQVEAHLGLIKQGEGACQGGFLYESSKKLHVHVGELQTLLVREWAKEGKKGGRK
jgi:hypothetical protein